MPVANRDVKELLGIILIHLPTAPARQLLSELSRSHAAENNQSFKETMRRLVVALDARSGGGAPCATCGRTERDHCAYGAPDHAFVKGGADEAAR